MGVFNYNCLLKTDLGYIRDSSTTRADLWNEVTPTVRYFRSTSTTVQKNPEGIPRTKGRD